MLHYSLTGNGELVLLIHGLLGSHRNLAGLTKFLSEEYRVCSIDLPNHGDSPSSESMDFKNIAASVCDVLDHLKISSPIRLLGHSLGGKVAMTFALAYPGRVSHLLIEDIAPVAYPPHHRDILDALLAIDIDILASREEAEVALRDAIPDQMTRQFVLTNLRRKTDGFMWKANIQSISECYGQIMAAVDTDAYQPYIGKTMFVAGQKSRYITADMSEAILSVFPSAQFRQIADAGHWIHAEKPQVFSALAKRFFN